MTLNEQKRGLLSLLSFVCEHDIQSHEQFYSNVNAFLCQEFGVSPMLVFREQECIWHQQLGTNKHITRFLKDSNLTEGQIGEWKEGKLGDDRFRALFLGQEEKENYYIVFKLSDGMNIDDEMFKFFVIFVQNAFSNNQKWREMEHHSVLSLIDDITGLYNHRRLLNDLDVCIDKYNEDGDGFVVLFIDIDHFKLINDQHGHLVGTRVLKELGNILRDVLRESDLIYRYGGDEFVMIVPSAGTEVARVIGERIINRVRDHEFLIEDVGALRTSVSIGVSIFPRDANSKHDILDIADKMMYHAKNAGRGRVCLAEELFS